MSKYHHDEHGDWCEPCPILDAARQPSVDPESGIPSEVRTFIYWQNRALALERLLIEWRDAALGEEADTLIDLVSATNAALAAQETPETPPS